MKKVFDVRLHHEDWGGFCVIAVAASAEEAIAKTRKAAMKQVKEDGASNIREKDFHCQSVEVINKRLVL